ncbi:NAD(P)/FAD-dependent oxidoreductase [Pseudoxanthomonas sp.]|uniref:NAD(P)/FAD-dependent oxidoreductase n=1 Tax=Pseudoxanthomonas sp. TaxID=1871049 RepID=UPI002FE06E07
MQDQRYDAIVVGAGFAGLACARELATHGLRVCVIDRKQDLGERMHTTGILVQEACDAPLLAGVPRALLRAVPHVRLYAPNLRSVRLGADGYRFYTTDTPALMRWMGEYVETCGVELRRGQAFRNATRTLTSWHVDGVGHARVLVGADGARSRVAHRLGLGQVTQFLYGVEYEFDGVALREPHALHCFINKRFAPGYLGWMAQTPTGVQAGLARRHHPGGTQVPDMAGFLHHVAPMTGLSATRRPDSIRAGLIPCGGPVRPMQREDVVLIGDAAGMVSPLTAGGIHAGLRHGATIGRSLVRALSGRAGPHMASSAVPAFAFKRALRWAFDHAQFDAPVNLLLAARPTRRVVEQLCFHRRGGLVPDPVEPD